MSAAAEDRGEIPEGLPAALPAGERLLWQGRPAWRPLAADAFHVRKVAVYFALLFAWRLASRLYDGAGWQEAAAYAAWILPLAVAGLAILALLAWATARTTIYTVTDRRVVLRIGVALQMTVNLPFGVVEAADLKIRPDGTGDIALRLEPGVRAAYLALWPHVRRWHFSRPEPALRSVPDAAGLAALMSAALAATADAAAVPQRTAATVPAAQGAAAASVAALGLAAETMRPKVA